MMIKCECGVRLFDNDIQLREFFWCSCDKKKKFEDVIGEKGYYRCPKCFLIKTCKVMY